MQKLDLHSTSARHPKGDLRADPRRAGSLRLDAPPHPHAVEATSGGLLRSTLKAAAAATAILVLFVLPAEYGVDVTGAGDLLGLTEMGEIKQQLYAEAAADGGAATPSQPRAITAPDITARLAVIEAQLGGIAAVVGASPMPAIPGDTAPPSPPAAEATPVAPAPAEPARVEPPARTAAVEAPASAAAAPAGWRDNASILLAPGEGIEIKLAMDQGQTATFEWSANGAVLNHDTHGDGGGQSVTYAQGRGVPGEAGELTAAFTGNHGWFWRNRSDSPVTLSMQVGGDYNRFIAP